MGDERQRGFYNDKALREQSDISDDGDENKLKASFKARVEEEVTRTIGSALILEMVEAIQEHGEGMVDS